ncbi:MAG: hypothetical protein ABI687_02900 [Flavitalea sp.]
MANINENLLVRGARGNVGKQFVFRKHGNNTNIGKMPVIRKDLAATEKQLEKRELFSSASLYAQGVISSAELKKEYQKKASPEKIAYNIAFRDYLKPPVVKKIDAENYHSAAGSIIVVHAKDDFRVAQVKVSIHTAAGILVEEGNAVLNPINRDRWTYTALQANSSLPGSVISATALDIPGNTGKLDMVV